MKALSIQQPWATLICTGLKDVENRTWKPVQIPGRILIHATAAKVPRNWEDVPSDVVSNVKNCRLMGQIPEYKDMVNAAIIGYAECYDIVQNAESIWAAPGQYHWCLRNARLFDNPIPGIKGVQGRLFDVPEIDDNNLPPSHESLIAFPEVQDKTLILPVSDAVATEIKRGSDQIAYDLTDTTYGLFFNPDTQKPITYKTIQFVSKDDVIEKQYDGVEAGPYLDSSGNPIEVLEFPGQGLNWSYCTLYFK